MIVETVAIIVAVVAICVAGYMSWTTHKVLVDVKGLLVAAQVHSQALGHSIDLNTLYTMRAGPPSVGELPFTSYDEYMILAIQKMGLVNKMVDEASNSR